MSNSNIVVYAVGDEYPNGKLNFHVYLSFSGQKEYIMTHRKNGFLYRTLKDGIRLNDLKRCQRNRMKGGNDIRHLVKVIDEYIEERSIN